MIRAVANKKIELSKDEYQYFLSLKEVFGEDSFYDLFTTNDSGNIVMIKPSAHNTSSMAVIFFLLNVMLNQRLRMLDEKINKFDILENRLKALEEETRNEAT
jgi:hypothetical protein